MNGDRSKKKDLTGAVWSQIEYHLQFNNTTLDARETTEWANKIKLAKFENDLWFCVIQSDFEDNASELKILQLTESEKSEVVNLVLLQGNYEDGAPDMSGITDINAKKLQFENAYILEIVYESN